MADGSQMATRGGLDEICKTPTSVSKINVDIVQPLLPQ